MPPYLISDFKMKLCQSYGHNFILLVNLFNFGCSIYTIVCVTAPVEGTTGKSQFCPTILKLGGKWLYLTSHLASLAFAFLRQDLPM